MNAEIKTTAELKLLNCRKVYNLIYQEKNISKQAIAQRLGMSLPTVTQNLAYLIEHQFIQQGGLFESTGGRPATIYQINSIFKVSIGVELLIEKADIVLVDLYGMILKEAEFPVPFKNSPAYYESLGTFISNFIEESPYAKEALLGVTIAVQGLVSRDGDTITYGELLNATGVTSDQFAEYIEFPVLLIHDTEAAAYAELLNSNITNAFFLSLNMFLGSALIVNGTIFRGCELGGGTIEHMRLHQDGKPCYCGKRGCVDSYCSARALINESALEHRQFFSRVRACELAAVNLWHSYLEDLALAIYNVRMVIDCDFILGGLLSEYINDADISLLKEMVSDCGNLPSNNLRIIKSNGGRKATISGAAMQRVCAYLENPSELL